MASGFTRRQVLTATTASLLAAAAPRLVVGQPSASLAVTDLGSDLALISGAGANVVALAKADGVLLVDGGAAQHSAALQGVLAERWPGRRVEILFNSNWREEHTGANAALRAAGATIMAHENTKLWLGGDFLVEWEGRHYTPRPAAELPNKTFYKSGNVEFGGRARRVLAPAAGAYRRRRGRATLATRTCSPPAISCQSAAILCPTTRRAAGSAGCSTRRKRSSSGPTRVRA